MIKKINWWWFIETTIVCGLILLSTFMFVKATSNLLIYWIWFNLIAVCFCTITEPKNKILKTIWFYLITPVGKAYQNYKLDKELPIPKKISITIDIVFIIILVAAGWFVSATAYLITVIVSNKIYNKIEDR